MQTVVHPLISPSYTILLLVKVAPTYAILFPGSQSNTASPFMPLTASPVCPPKEPPSETDTATATTGVPNSSQLLES
jgi:hypothetical protein